MNLRLVDVPRRQPCRVLSVDVSPNQQTRLAELGIRQGIEVTYLSPAAGSSMIVGVDTNRIAIEKSLAKQISVEIIDEKIRSGADLVGGSI